MRLGVVAAQALLLAGVSAHPVSLPDGAVNALEPSVVMQDVPDEGTASKPLTVPAVSSAGQQPTCSSSTRACACSLGPSNRPTSLPDIAIRPRRSRPRARAPFALVSN